jgi:hypothetical protein
MYRYQKFKPLSIRFYYKIQNINTTRSIHLNYIKRHVAINVAAFSLFHKLGKYFLLQPVRQTPNHKLSIGDSLCHRPEGFINLSLWRICSLKRYYKVNRQERLFNKHWLTRARQRSTSTNIDSRSGIHR